MANLILFPFEQYWGFYLGFTVFVLIMLLIDLGIFHRTSHTVSIKESVTWSLVWVSLALLFNVGLYFYAGHAFTQNPSLMALPGFDPDSAARQIALEFLTGFIIEKSLAIDNIFVFAVVFSYFNIPTMYQHRILFFGVLGALVFRAIFIALGAALVQHHWVVVVAGVFLILTGFKILFAPEKAPDPNSNPLIKLVRKFIPVDAKIEGPEFFVRRQGALYATPLFLALVFIEFSDIIFSIDSVPAIFAITKEPLMVFTSNVFAILGLRSLYFVLAGLVHRFRFLKYGLGVILIFVGLKMTWLNDMFGGKFPVLWSLAIIMSVLASSVLASNIYKVKTASGE